MAGRIDSIAMINLSLVATEDLQWKYETGSSIASGTGKQKTYSYRNGVETPIGDIEFSVWCAAAEYVIKRDGLQEEQEHLQEFFSRSRSQDKCQSLSPKVLALRFCIHGLYKDPEWVSFVPYNRCQRQFEIVRKRRRNFVVFRRGGVTKIRCFLAQKECSRFAVSGA